MPPSRVPGNTHLHRAEIHKRVQDRLRRTEGIKEVVAKPSPMRPTRVRATVDPETFLGGPYSSAEATVEFEWRPREGRDVFRIQYSESDAPWSCGWHQDETHDDLGPHHFQVDHREWDAPYREPGPFGDPNPMAVLETCLEELRAGLPDLPADVR